MKNNTYALWSCLRLFM